MSVPEAIHYTLLLVGWLYETRGFLNQIYQNGKDILVVIRNHRF